jgi:DNA polymerase
MITVKSYDSAYSELQAIEDEIRVCTRCELHNYRIKAVPGAGVLKPKMMLVGEAPGREEDLQGRPFVGRAGKVLDAILGAVGIQREDLFITSVVKCRPPSNRTPRRREADTCIQAFLHRQMDVIKPVMICLLGGVASKAFLEEERITDIRGKFIRRDGMLFFPTFHPAAAARSRRWFSALTEDLRRLRYWF